MAKTPKEHEPKRFRPTMFEDEPIKGVKEKSLATERRLAQEIGFDLTPGSGNQFWPGGKGDGRHPVFMFEAKETKHASVTMGPDVIGKLCREASAVGKDPALILTMYGLPEPLPKDWVCVPSEVFRSLLEAYMQRRGE